ncbi:MAG: hypothetical protein J6S30_00645 [Kiritimatiellae bacterium]|nr:hypothetical protein [Kiritimatiellia bacterium]
MATIEERRSEMQLLEIERELESEGAEAALQRYDAILAQLDERISEAMQGGLPPDEYARVAALKEANLLARKIMRLSVREGRVKKQEALSAN